jgi:hypothetical protein
MEKRFTKVVKNAKTGRTKTVKYGQAGKAKDGGDRIRQPQVVDPALMA